VTSCPTFRVGHFSPKENPPSADSLIKSNEAAPVLRNPKARMPTIFQGGIIYVTRNQPQPDGHVSGPQPEQRVQQPFDVREPPVLGPAHHHRG
jgi:hypothetical protein